MIDTSSSVDRSMPSDSNNIKDAKSYAASGDRQVSQDATHSQGPDQTPETTEERLMRQGSPLSELAAEPSTAERLVSSQPAYHAHTSTLPQDHHTAVEEPPASTVASNTAQTVITTAKDLVQETLDAVRTFADPAEKIAQLNSDGDQVVMVALAQVEGQFVAGLKLRYGYDITIEQVGNPQAPGVMDDANVQYQVSFNKRLLAGVGVELPAPVAELKGELRGFTDDTAIMTFETQAEATTAVRILQRAALTETVSDATSAGTTVPGQPVTSMDTPAANPIRSPEADPTSMLESVGISPTAEELAFIGDHITGYRSTLGAEAPVKFGVEAPALLGYELRLDAADTITRTVTLPGEGQPGRISYTISGAFDASSKEILDLGPKLFDAFELAYGAENVVHHGELRIDITFHWDIPASEWPQANPSSSLLPETSLLTTGDARPDSIETKLTLTHQAQSLTDPSRTDLMRYTMASTLTDPLGAASQTVSSLLLGDMDGALASLSADSGSEIIAERIDRTGVRQEHGIDFEAVDVVEGKLKIIFEAGIDDTSPLNAAATNDPIEVPEPAAMNGQMVVVPRSGVNLRRAPGVGSAGTAILYHGTFVQPTGAEAVDGHGTMWLEVSGPDVNDQQALGWVRADLVIGHSAGAMNESGRINPQLEAAGYREITVVDGNNLWDLALSQGVGFDEMVALNSDHIIAPDLIFPGDTIYVPNTEGELLPEIVPDESVSAPGKPDSRELSESLTRPPADSSSVPGLVNESDTLSDTQATSTEDFGSEAESSPANSAANTPDTVSSVSDGHTAPMVPAGGKNGDEVANVDQTGRADLDGILRNYQVVDDPGGMIENYTPDLLPGPLEGIGVGIWNRVTGDDINLTLDRAITAKESTLLDGLRLGGLMDLNDATQFARNSAQSRVGTGLEDGHGDAFRHALWNAVMTRELGAEFTRAFANAHEGVPGNPADKEAMDLYNNEIGRRIALDNPDASQDELVDLVMDALNGGKLIVVDGKGDLAWSDQVAWGKTGYADDTPVQGVIDPVAEVNSH